jgi:hypothetical protein
LGIDFDLKQLRLCPLKQVATMTVIRSLDAIGGIPFATLRRRLAEHSQPDTDVRHFVGDR